MIGIYKITSPKGRIYIGQSVNINRRFSEYKNLLCKKQGRLYNSFNKYGVENHKFEIIEECCVDELNNRERYWQEYYNVIGDNGLNLFFTNCGDRSGFLSDITKKKLSSSLKGNKNNLGNKHSEETKKKISIRSSGRKHTEEAKQKVRISRTGTSLKQETKIKISNSLRGKKYNISKESRDIKSKYMSDKFSKKVLDVDTGVVYKSAKEYSDIKKVNYNKVRNILAGHIKNIYNIKRYV